MSCYPTVNGGFTQVFMGNFNHAKWGLGGRSEIMTIGRKNFNVQPKTFHQPPFLPIFFDNIPSHTGCLKWAVFFFDLLLKINPGTQLSGLVYEWYTERLCHGVISSLIFMRLLSQGWSDVGPVFSCRAWCLSSAEWSVVSTGKTWISCALLLLILLI